MSRQCKAVATFVTSINYITKLSYFKSYLIVRYN